MYIIKLQVSGAIDHISKPGGLFLSSYAFISEKHQLLEIIEKGKCLVFGWNIDMEIMGRSFSKDFSFWLNA